MSLITVLKKQTTITVYNKVQNEIQEQIEMIDKHKELHEQETT